MRRIAIVLFCSVLLALSWWRSPLPSADSDPRVTFAALPLPDRPAFGPGLSLEGVWVLRGEGDDFGGYSALVSLGNGNLLSASDRGRYLRFADPSRGEPQPRMGWFLMKPNEDKREADCESLTRDPATGTLWASYEHSNAIVRADTRGRRQRTVRPAAMRDWPSNGGPEAMLRLADGRFLVLSESREGWFARIGPALLFPSDPAEGAKPVTFHFQPPSGYRPTDLGQLPDGRILVLVRAMQFVPPGFSAKILIADPADIREGETWEGKIIADLAAPLPEDNYEGLAVEPADDGSATVWVISDDNRTSFQRTILLKLHWQPQVR
ncbi:hypothetical protein MB02_09050 [Croceicoccus estronivorus]|uniref:esterase-like activity of phytase family protein n=1 Tax=Croceicoccus estronivorus TaxID=1172626 RepID=UPI00082B2A00|nr:esterase-like activity of phytase family protein [Croceicoccus estronivorus]OCC23951.1 hypothetical protein MB02_09050 [Croceicoccus estronivorus]